VTVLGDPEAWLSQFVSIDDRLLARIAALWPTCRAVLPAQPPEDVITLNLVAVLCKDPIVRRICHWVEFQFEPFATDNNGARFSRGKIDIGVLLDWERERYLAYECKRLNVLFNGSRASLAGDYVTKGMMRFMTEQYAEGLPVGFMLGYVMDSDIGFAIGQLTKTIAAQRQPLNLQDGPKQMPSLQQLSRFLTIHKRSSDARLELRHALLPFASISNRPQGE
jgi:hypothetical protein